MKTLIVYSSKYGTAKTCAEELSSAIGNSELYSSDTHHVPSLETYDRIIIGTSVYMGKSRKNIRKFISANHDLLMEKELGLFICSKETKDFDQLFTNEIAKRAATKGHFGFELHPSNLRPVDKFRSKKINSGLIDYNDIDHKAIQKFIKSLSK